MKKIFQILCISVAMLLVNNVSAMPMPDGDFLGVNVSMEHCRMQTDDYSFVFKGDVKIKKMENKNYIIATCKAEAEVEFEQAEVVRDDITCRIAKKNPDFEQGGGHGPGHGKMIHYKGIGGFTITPSGQVIGRCKADKQLQEM